MDGLSGFLSDCYRLLTCSFLIDPRGDAVVILGFFPGGAE